MTDFNLTDFSFDELVALENQIKDLKVSKKEIAKADNIAAKEARVAKFKGNLGSGDTVSFLYGRNNETFEGTVIRASEKSVTVKSDVFADNGKKDTNYVRYDRIVEVLVKAPLVEEATPEDTAEAV